MISATWEQVAELLPVRKSKFFEETFTTFIDLNLDAEELDEDAVDQVVWYWACRGYPPRLYREDGHFIDTATMSHVFASLRRSDTGLFEVGVGDLLVRNQGPWGDDDKTMIVYVAP